MRRRLCESAPNTQYRFECASVAFSNSQKVQLSSSQMICSRCVFCPCFFLFLAVFLIMEAFALRCSRTLASQPLLFLDTFFNQTKLSFFCRVSLSSNFQPLLYPLCALLSLYTTLQGLALLFGRARLHLICHAQMAVRRSVLVCLHLKHTNLTLCKPLFCFLEYFQAAFQTINGRSPRPKFLLLTKITGMEGDTSVCTKLRVYFFVTNKSNIKSQV